MWAVVFLVSTCALLTDPFHAGAAILVGIFSTKYKDCVVGALIVMMLMLAARVLIGGTIPNPLVWGAMVFVGTLSVSCAYLTIKRRMQSLYKTLKYVASPEDAPSQNKEGD